MNIVNILVAVVFSTSLYAGCIEDFRMFQNRSLTQLVPVRVIEIHSKSGLKKLRSAELKAVKNYMSYLEFSFDGDNGLEITTEQYRSLKNKDAIGYKISVTDGGDESGVRYYIKIDEGTEDVAYPILYRIWDNQSPEYDFLCEKN